ncbi:hypothetical protein PENSPDRAFT_335947 [Peniophora sp. CONT]|nr:hypothetical protein PENSPDRAFT_335947 [Peniophora sp. CONT]
MTNFTKYSNLLLAMNVCIMREHCSAAAISLSRSRGHNERRVGWMEGCPDNTGGTGRRGTVPVNPSSPDPRLPAAILFYLFDGFAAFPPGEGVCTYGL